jgi:hypothetical protein
MEKCEFIEEEFISAFNVVLSHLPGRVLRINRISQAKEGEVGYDGTLKLKKMVYLQFKRSDFHSRIENSKFNNERNVYNSEYNKDFYSFKLLKNIRNRDCYNQHNCLMNLSLENDAFYCAPLFHTKKELEKFNKDYSQYHSNRKKFITHRARNIHGYYVDRILSNTICIKPHKIVTDNECHYYTYDKYEQVYFHSEIEKINNEDSFLFLNYVEKLPDIPTDNTINFRSIIKYLIKVPLEDDGIFFYELCDYYNYYYDTNYEYNNFNDLLNSIDDIKIDNYKLGIILEYYLKDIHNIYQYGIFT